MRANDCPIILSPKGKPIVERVTLIHPSKIFTLFILIKQSSKKQQLQTIKITKRKI
jgi:hypothetical protein